MSKRLLELKACGSSADPHECNGIYKQAQFHTIEPVCKYVQNNDDLEHVLLSNGQFVFLSGSRDRYLSHTNRKGILGNTFSVFGYYIDVRCKKEEVILN